MKITFFFFFSDLDNIFQNKAVDLSREKEQTLASCWFPGRLDWNAGSSFWFER